MKALAGLSSGFACLLVASMAGALGACLTSADVPVDSVADPRTDVPSDLPGDLPGEEGDPTKPTEPAPRKVDFRAIYAEYMGPGTDGRCGASGCHSGKKGGFLCGSTDRACYDGLIKSGLVTMDEPTASPLVDDTASPLTWIRPGGNMPPGGHANPAAALAIRKWLAAGALFDSTVTTTSPDAGPPPADSGTDTGVGSVDAAADARADAAPVDAGRVDSGAADSGAADSGVRDAGRVDSGVDSGAADAGPAAPTWTSIYGKYFGAGTPGSCGSAGCHAATQGGFRCGSSKATCFTGLVNAGIIDPANPAGSDLISAAASPLRWISANGRMPPAAGAIPAAARAEIRAWVLAGAKNN
jgi:hypothetical protein